MPALYAHFLFGQKVKDLLPPETAKVVEDHAREYLLGLQGPDFLYYYHPLRRNTVTGGKIHWEPASGFLEHAASVLREENDEGRLAYILGFICHFTLDSGCHPIVRGSMERDGATHAAIETEFDRLLMRLHRLDPDCFSPKPLLPKGSAATQCAAPFYPGAVRGQLNRSLRMMRCCLSVLYSRRKTSKRLLRALMFLTFSREGRGLIAREKPDPHCSGALERLLPAFSEACATAAEQIDNFLAAMRGTEPLNARFARHFE